jgi:hypothetical protein
MADAAALELHARLTSPSLPVCLARPVKKALAVLEAALRLYSPPQLLLSFNGGKDATVVLHLARAAFAARGAGQPACVYWDDRDCFPEVQQFVTDSVRQYALPMRTYDCSFGDGLKDCVEKRGTAAVVLGTRLGDPNAAGAECFEPSSPGWPSFMRINPILTWSFRGALPVPQPARPLLRADVALGADVPRASLPTDSSHAAVDAACERFIVAATGAAHHPSPLITLPTCPAWCARACRTPPRPPDRFPPHPFRRRCTWKATRTVTMKRARRRCGLGRR